MEVLQEIVLQTLRLYHEADPYIRPIKSSLSSIYASLYPTLLPFLNRLALFAQDSPALVSVGVLLLFLLIAVQILGFIKRVLVWWFKLVVRITLWGLLAVLIGVVWQRGVGRTVADAAGWGQELGEVWWREYRRWEGYQKQQAGRQGTRAGSAWR